MVIKCDYCKSVIVLIKAYWLSADGETMTTPAECPICRAYPMKTTWFTIMSYSEHDAKLHGANFILS